MKKMGIIYGSSTGTCESIAQTIAEKLGVASVDAVSYTHLDVYKRQVIDSSCCAVAVSGRSRRESAIILYSFMFVFLCLYTN